jgi:hypothetical protein
MAAAGSIWDKGYAVLGSLPYLGQESSWKGPDILVGSGQDAAVVDVDVDVDVVAVVAVAVVGGGDGDR